MTDDITAALSDLYEVQRATDAKISKLHMRAIALAVRERYPQATAFGLEWSDQGGNDWHYYTAFDSNDVPCAGDLVDDLYPFTIEGRDMHTTWKEFTPNPEEFRDDEYSPDTARLDIDRVLTFTEGTL